MVQSKATSVKEYLDELPDDRRQAISEIRQTILKNLPEGYEEVMNWGMITYQIPLSRYPETYNGKPLMYAALASQKNHMAVYLSAVYSSEESAQEFKEAYKETGKKLDMGKSCVRFTKLENLPLPLIGKTIAKTNVDDFIRIYEKARS